MEGNLNALTTIFTEFYYFVTIVMMFLIHVGFCTYEVGVSRTTQPSQNSDEECDRDPSRDRHLLTCLAGGSTSHFRTDRASLAD